MFGLSKMFSRKVEAAKEVAAKIESKDMLEAVVAGATLVIYADGSAEQKEFDTLKALLRANEKLSHFGSDIDTTIDRFVQIMEAGYNTGRVKVMQEIRDCKHDTDDKMEIFAMLLDVAQADGEVDDKEIAVLRTVGRELNVSLSDFGLE